MTQQSSTIADQGIIENTRSAALVGVDGTVDFFCFPELDSPSVFASVLDSDRAGAFRIRLADNGYALKQLYVSDTNVLLSRFV